MPLLYHAADHLLRDVGVCAMLIVIVFRDARAAVLHYLFKVATLRPQRRDVQVL